MANTHTKMETITTEEINTRADELSKVHNVKVTPIVFFDEDTNEKIVGYLKEPTRLQKQRALDKTLISQSSAGEDLLMACLIKEESNPRIYSESSNDDAIVMGACQAALATVKLKQNIAKKN